MGAVKITFKIYSFALWYIGLPAMLGRIEITK